MTHEQIKQRFPNASRSFIEANLSVGDTWKNSELECPAWDESLAANQSQETATGKLHIRFASVRKRLCDPDNLSPKWLLDCLRYSKIITGDEPEKITLEVVQSKAIKGEAEHTVIEVSDL